MIGHGAALQTAIITHIPILLSQKYRITLKKKLDGNSLFGYLAKYDNREEETMTDNKDYEQMAGVFKALAHSTRLIILDKLREKEHCVCELQEVIGSDMSTVSRHLSVLRNAGIVSSRKVNNQVIYWLLYPCVLDAFHCVMDIKAKS
ncbi:MAG: metalloregulator ArsR/SmtB family transcription factor [Candidatus Cloacimonadaceae bacterium]|jgi:ArsR family transcriptional regulator|nr:metalloregulator ArsR/SmtB family transcription factor [Candidatus Cloacimonadaceae bacterium]